MKVVTKNMAGQMDSAIEAIGENAILRHYTEVYDGDDYLSSTAYVDLPVIAVIDPVVQEKHEYGEFGERVVGQYMGFLESTVTIDLTGANRYLLIGQDGTQYEVKDAKDMLSIGGYKLGVDVVLWRRDSA